MAKKTGLSGREVGRGYQIPKPFDIVTTAMGDPRQPTMELVDYGRNMGLYDMTDFGFGPGKPYPQAVDAETLIPPYQPEGQVKINGRDRAR